jgi:malonyl-CoA/methylmalonyl-CoA synthetase
VVGVPDPEWGERVGAAVVLKNGQQLSLEELRSWCRERLANYKLPSRLRVIPALPRNAMGKVTKPAIATGFRENEDA